jgi:DNA-binding PadR family transcriptional regulator
MGHHGQHGGPGQWGSWGQPWGASPWGAGPPWGRGGRPGPPPWLAGLFGLAQNEPQRPQRARRGDVRAAILAVLEDDPLNGYQIISAISERTGGAWKPSPGSVYPTISQLEDEGLIEGDDERGRRTLRLSDAGREYVAANADELAGVWEPFAEPAHEEGRGDYANLKPEIGQVMNAVWQIITTGTDQQRRDAIDILVETRRKLYGLLAEGDTE